LCICTSAAPQRPAQGTVSSQVATHLRTDKVCRVLGRSWIRTQDYWFAVRCATIEPPLLLKPLQLAHIKSFNIFLSIYQSLSRFLSLPKSLIVSSLFPSLSLYLSLFLCPFFFSPLLSLSHFRCFPMFLFFLFCNQIIYLCVFLNTAAGVWDGKKMTYDGDKSGTSLYIIFKLNCPAEIYKAPCHKAPENFALFKKVLGFKHSWTWKGHLKIFWKRHFLII
jgi:hypothetical protein